VVRKRGACPGYALLVVLFVTAAAAVALAACVSVLVARQGVAAADRTSAVSTDGLRAGLYDVCDALRWTPWSPTGALERQTPSAGDWSAAWRREGAVLQEWPTFTLNLTSRRTRARRYLRAVVQLRTEPFVGGLSVGGDVEITAATTVVGGGLYAAGDLRGRELVTFEGPVVGVSTPDGVHPERWPLAAVHVGGTIWALGREIHGSGSEGLPGPWAVDDDEHTGTPDLGDLVEGPSSLLVPALEEHGDARTGDLGVVVDLGALPATPPEGAAAGPGAGYIVVLRPGAGRCVEVVGQRRPGACPVVLVVDGDAAVGSPGLDETISLGTLIVTGNLTVQGPLRHVGHVYAGDLRIAAPTRVETPIGWRSEPPPGLAAPVVVSVSDEAS
jgi:hypothetical protein